MLGEWAYWVLIGSAICAMRRVLWGRCNGLLVKTSPSGMLRAAEGFFHFMCGDRADLVVQEIWDTVRKAREGQQQIWLNTTEKSP